MFIKVIGKNHFLKHLTRRIKEDEIGATGAQIAYYSLLSFFPFLIFIISLAKYVNVSSGEIYEIINFLVPQEVLNVTKGITQDINNSYFLSIIGVMSTIWLASKGIGAAIRGLNKAYDVDEARSFWKVKGWALLYTIVLSLVLVLLFTLLVFGRFLISYIINKLGINIHITYYWDITRYLFLVALIYCVFTAFYLHAPNAKFKISQVIYGAGFSTVGWIATTGIFEFYINNFANYSNLYGGIGGIFILLIWLYLSGIILMIGGEINAVLLLDICKSKKKKRRFTKFG